jgi:HAD superfamily hydrolase (TIGR01509 family)
MKHGGLLGSGPLLLDFDGPVCSLFAGYPAPQIARELLDLLRSADTGTLAISMDETDPLEVLRAVGASCSRELTQAVDDALRAAERRAAASAIPTPGSHNVIQAANRLGVRVALVSNNSAEAVELYLADHGLTRYIGPVIGRAYADPGRMKPNPEPILSAIHALNVGAADCTLIGDSLSDIEAGRAAGVRVVGYANRAGKVEPFAVADAVITSMNDILVELTPA